MEKLYYINMGNDFENYFNSFINAYLKDNTIRPIIRANKDFYLSDTFKSQFNSIISKFANNKINTRKLTFSVTSENNHYNQTEWKKIIEINDFFNKKQIEFGFDDLENIFPISAVENANKKITDTANMINHSHLSPVEKILKAYMEVTSREYTEEDKNTQHYSASRSLYSILNNKEIVCVGFAKWFKAIIEEMKLDNVKVYENSILVKNNNNNNIDKHKNIVLYIKDEKYNIDGYYYLDPTWDCGHNYETTQHLQFFLVPLKDIKNIQENEILSKTDSNISSRSFLSFGGNRLSYSYSFIDNLKNDNKKLVQSIIKQYYKDKISEVQVAFEKNNSNLSKIDFIKELLNDNELSKNIDKTFYSYNENDIKYALFNGDYNEFLAKLKELSLNSKIDVIMNSFEEEFNSYINEDEIEIENENQKDEFDFLVKNKDYIIQEVKKAFTNNIEYFKPYLSAFSIFLNFHSFINYYILKAKEDNISIEDMNFEEMLKDCLAILVKKDDYEFNIIDFLNKIKDELNDEHYFSEFSHLEEQCNYYMENIDEFIENVRYEDKFFDYLTKEIYNSSKTISIDKMYLMLSNVYALDKLDGKDNSKQIIFKKVNDTISKNAINNEYYFKKNSGNMFSGLSKFYEENEKE